MHLSDDVLEELRQIYRDEFGESLTRDEAYELGNRLVSLFALFAQTQLDGEEAPRG